MYINIMYIMEDVRYNKVSRHATFYSYGVLMYCILNNYSSILPENEEKFPTSVYIHYYISLNIMYRLNLLGSQLTNDTIASLSKFLLLIVLSVVVTVALTIIIR